MYVEWYDVFYLKSWTNIAIGHIWWSNTNVINLILRVMSHLPYITCDNENIHPKSHSRKLTFPTICCEKCWSITNLPFPSLQSKPYRWCSGRLLTSSALDRGVDLQLSQTKDITIGIWCLHTVVRAMNGWLGIRVVFPIETTYLIVNCCFSELAIWNIVVPLQSGRHHHFVKCISFRSRLTLYNNYSLTHFMI